MYGNTSANDPSATRIFPYIMSKLVDYFSFKNSRFSVTKSKETTARISLYRVLKIPCIYTMEASFCGADQGEFKDMHFESEHFKNCGRQLFFALIVYCKIDCHEVLFGQKKQIEAGEADTPELKLDDVISEFDTKKEELICQSDTDSDDGSDSEPSEDNMSDKEISKILPVKIKKKPNRLVSQGSFKKRQKELENKLKEKAAAKREELK